MKRWESLDYIRWKEQLRPSDDSTVSTEYGRLSCEMDRARVERIASITVRKAL